MSCPGPEQHLFGKDRDQLVAAVWVVVESSRTGEGCFSLLSKCLGALACA